MRHLANLLALALCATLIKGSSEVKTARTYNNEGVKQLNSHAYEKAVVSLEKAVSLAEPDSRVQMEALGNLSVALHALGRIEEEREAQEKEDRIWAKLNGKAAPGAATSSSADTTADMAAVLAEVRKKIRAGYLPPKEGMSPPIVVLRLSKSGTIVDTFVSQPSEPPIWGKSLLQAIKSSEPFDLPSGKFKQYIDLSVEGTYALKVKIADLSEIPAEWH